MDKKKIAIIIAAIALIILAVVLCVFLNKEPNNSSIGNKNNSNNISQSNTNIELNDSNNTNEQKEPELPTTFIEGTKTLDALIFSDFKIVEEEPGRNLLIATVKNNGTENILDGIVLDIELFSKDGNSIGIAGGSLPFVAADSSATMQVPIAADVMHTADLTLKYTQNP